MNGGGPADAAPDRSALMPTYPDPPITVVSGEGTELVDNRGRRYLDFVGGIAVVSLGHAHPEVVAALTAQARRLWHVSNLYGNELAPAVAVTLDRLVGGGEHVGGQTFFANSGAEANECALKLAYRWGGSSRRTVVAAWGSFHGRTLATLSATGQPAKRAPFEPLPRGFTHVPYDDLAALEAVLERGGVAAVLVEPLLGEGGVVAPSPGYLQGVRELCDEHDALLIVDEIQTGLGRTGDWFGFQADGMRPDVVTMAKALGNGMPAGACWARAEVAALFEPGQHGTTFGGQPLAMAAVKATLDIMEREDVCLRARERGSELAAGLARLPHVARVRGRGLLLGAVLEGVTATEVADSALRAGLLVNPVCPDTLRLAPPLLVTHEEVGRALEILSNTLSGSRA